MSQDCLKTAKKLLEEELFRRSISSSYYAAYSAIKAELVAKGISRTGRAMELYFAENVSATIIPERQLERLSLFNRLDLYVTPARNGYERELIQCRTCGSGDHHFSFDIVAF